MTNRWKLRDLSRSRLAFGAYLGQRCLHEISCLFRQRCIGLRIIVVMDDHWFFVRCIYPSSLLFEMTRDLSLATMISEQVDIGIILDEGSVVRRE